MREQTERHVSVIGLCVRRETCRQVERDGCAVTEGSAWAEKDTDEEIRATDQDKDHDFPEESKQLLLLHLD